MATKRNVIAEIEDLRGRMTAIEDFDNGILKLLTIITTTQKLADDQEDELHAYFLVACIAAIETYFRWQIRKVIDFDHGRFLNNIRLDDQPIKLTHDVAVALISKRITVGELIAHTIGFSDLERATGFMTKLLGTDFLQLVEKTRDESGSASILEEPARVFSDVKRALELRHLICHEGQTAHLIPNSDIKQLSSSCYMFARGCHYAVARFLSPSGPATREHAYGRMVASLDALKIRLTELERVISERLYSTMEQDAFLAVGEAWRSYVSHEAAFFASVHMNGNQAELDAVRTRVRLTEKRIEEFERLLDRSRKVDELAKR